MVAAVSFDLASLTHPVSSGAGKVAAALVIAAVAYLLLAGALSLLRPAETRESSSDVAGFVLITALAAFVISGLLLDALGFAILSVAVIGLAALATVAGELKSVVARLHHHAHGH
jgi:hypothetical protein